MTRCGRGPKFSAAAGTYGIPVGWLTYRYPDVLSIECIPYWILVCIASILMTAGTIIYINALHTFNTGYRKEVLVTEKAFSLVRHPIYAAWIWLIIPGFILFFHSWLLLATPLVAYITFKCLIHQEDEYLQEEFGESYLNYKSRVNDMFPSIF